MLHDISPPSKNGPAIDRRRGYSALQGEDDVTIDDSARDHDTQATEEELEREEERGIARRDGWSALGWSFAVSASMTACSHSASYDLPLMNTVESSSWHISFPLSSRSRCLDTTWQGNGYGRLLRVYHMLGKVRVNLLNFDDLSLIYCE